MPEIINPSIASPASREAWIAASDFHSVDEKTVFAQLYDRLASAQRQERPTVVLDLDSTLYEVHHRTHHILQLFVSDEGHRLSRETRRHLAALDKAAIGYSLHDTFAAAGLSLAEPAIEGDLRRAKNFWWQRFMSNDFLEHDLPYPGAVEFVHKLVQHGAHVIYLTGRSTPLMHSGSLQKLRVDGFPLDPAHTELVTKPHPDDDDVAHKRGVITKLRSENLVLASFENEPANFSALLTAAPEAMHVFMDTICSDHPAPPVRGAYKIRSFLDA